VGPQAHRARDRRRPAAWRPQRAEIAARFHETLAQVIATACRRARERTGLDVAALSGGCFQNRRLAERAAALLEQAGFEVLIHRHVPPNDGGIALGQAAVAARRLRREVR
jgi:hydrogenase maturation protein HypF